MTLPFGECTWFLRDNQNRIGFLFTTDKNKELLKAVYTETQKYMTNRFAEEIVLRGKGQHTHYLMRCKKVLSPI